MNLLTLCMVCHSAIERGSLKATGSAPDQITWEGPFGVIEEPLEAASEEVSSGGARYEEIGDDTVVVSLGITEDGTKVPLGLRLGSTENAPLCTSLLQDLLERGLRILLAENSDSPKRAGWPIDSGS